MSDSERPEVSARRRPWWTWPFPNRLAALMVPLLSIGELLALSLGKDHLSFTDPPTVFTASLLTIAMWWLASWAFHLADWVTGWMKQRWFTRWVRNASFVIIATTVIAGWLFSWCLYYLTGRFASFETIRFLLQTLSHWELLWMPAASSRGFLLLLASVSALLGTFFVFARPGRIRNAITEVRPRGLLRFGYSLLGLYLVWIGLTAWCLSGLSDLRKMQRSEAFTKKTSPAVTLTLSCLSAIQVEQIPADALDVANLQSIRFLRKPGERTENLAAARHNVIIVQIESLRSDCIGLVHQGREVTPNLNRLADGGVQFANAFSQSTHSNYADPCITSSLYPLREQMPRSYRRGDPYPKKMLHDVLKPLGYATAIISSQNEAWFGMDQFYDTPNLDWLFDPQRAEHPSKIDIRDGGLARESLSGMLKGGKFVDSFTVDTAIEWMARQQVDETRFCLQMNLQSSHFPYPLPDTVPRPFKPCELNFSASFVSYPRDKTQVVRNAYYNAIAECDRQVGRIIDALRASEQFDKTILIVVGENGESFYDDGTVTHAGPPSQAQLHVAWVMSAPGLAERAVVQYPAELIDVVPTTLGLLGLPSDPNHQGIDLLAENRPDLSERFLFFHVNSPSFQGDATIWGGRWKYVKFDPGTWDHAGDPTGRGEALFDLSVKNAETNNLIQARPQIASVLRSVLQKWRMQQLAYYHYPHFYLRYCPPPPPTGPASSDGIGR